MRKKHIVYLLSFILFFITGCDLLNNEDPNPDFDIEDDEANLVILNYSNERIVFSVIMLGEPL